jgi:putative peptidoglycan lipid II flippase
LWRSVVNDSIMSRNFPDQDAPSPGATPPAMRGQSRGLIAVYAQSRVLGLGREIGVAIVFGTTFAADQLSAGLVVAGLASLVVGEMVFATHVRRDGDGERAASLGWPGMTMSAIAISLAYLVPGAVVTFAILPSQPLLHLLTVTACLAPSVGFAAAAGLPNAVLTLSARVARVNLARSCWSAGALIGLLAEHELGGGVAVVAAGWSAGTVAGFALATHWARRVAPPGPGRGPSAVNVRLAAPVALAFGLISVQGIVDRVIAGRLGEGSVAALGYADRLFLLPVGFVTSAIAPLVLAAVVHHKREGGGADGAAVVAMSARLLTVAVPASLLVFAASPLIVDAVLRYGEFDARSAELTAGALDGLAIGIGATSLALILYRAMQAVLPLGELARVAGAALCASAVMSVALATVLGLRGVALGTALAAAVAIHLQARRLGMVFGSAWERTFRSRVVTPAIACTILGSAMCVAVTELGWMRAVAAGLAVAMLVALRRSVPCSP